MTSGRIALVLEPVGRVHCARRTMLVLSTCLWSVCWSRMKQTQILQQIEIYFH